MNYGISILFRAIPLAMAAFCFAYGAYVFAAGDDPSRLTAGPVLFFLGSICIALYCTAATIIRQIIGTYTAAAKYLFPARIQGETERMVGGFAEVGTEDDV